MLPDVRLKDHYSSDEDDIVNDFYNPVLSKAVAYDRITGYFSPSVFAIAARGFSGLISNGGKIRILTSVQVSSETYDAIIKSGDMNEGAFREADLNMDELLNELQKDYLRIFMYLYKIGLLEMKIAVLKNSSGILHQKIGIVRDRGGNAISFSGSNNETIGGILNNIEEFKVFRNWTIASSPYFASDESKFDKYWSDDVEGIKVVGIGSAIRDKLLSVVDVPDDVTAVIERIRKQEREQEKESNGQEELPSRSLRDYQIDAINHWINNGYKSIFEMATGTGKTFTAISALKTFREKNSYLRAVVVVPLTTLSVQWKEDIKKVIPDITILNTSTDPRWKDELNNLSLSRKLGRNTDYILITTYSMFTKEDFNDRLIKLGDDLILLADEMHNLVNKNRLNTLGNPAYRYRLGLSATPTRLWQQEDSIVARKIFGDNSYQFTLSEAIDKGFLVPYHYHPLPVHLDADEYDKYVELSKDISRLSQYKSDNGDENSALNMKLIERSRIKKNAEGKIFTLENSLRSLQHDGPIHDALIYVDNEAFLSKLQIMLTRNNIRTTKFTGENKLDERLSTIDNLRNHSINAIIAIKCLDEGVDIPSAKTAFFLSNNTDPREYVQRLGRVLRLDIAGDKTISEIYDYLVMPPADIAYKDEADRNIARNMIKNELIRSKFFNELSSNSGTAQDIIDDAVDKYGFYYEENELTYNTGEE